MKNGIKTTAFIQKQVFWNMNIYPSKQRRAFVLDKIYFNVLLNSKNIY